MSSKTITVQIFRDGAMCFVPVPFDPRAVFGKVRVPVKVTLNGYTYRSTIARMGAVTCIPLRKSNREAAGLKGNETLKVKIELDTEVREVRVPQDLEHELQRSKATWDRWQSLSYTHKREHVEAIEGAKKEETRARRVAYTMRLLREPKKSGTAPPQRTRR
jgi:hypothetical protein